MTENTPIKISLIAAVAENGVIGRNKDLPWRIRSEFQYFKDTTMGKPLIFGRKSFEGLNGPLPGRPHVVITRNPAAMTAQTIGQNVVVTTTFEDALEKAKDLARASSCDEVFVAGGTEIYRLALPHADRLYLTEIHMSPEGDTYFPPFVRDQWKETRRDHHPALPGEDASYTITLLERK